jgi:hypothetical protein
MEIVAEARPTEKVVVSLDEFCRKWSAVEKAAFRKYVRGCGCGLVLEPWQWESLSNGFDAADLRQTQAAVVYSSAW